MSFVIACRAIIYKAPYLLSVQQSDVYCLPGGSLELDETLGQCLVREIEEELNFSPTNNKLIAINELMIGSNHRVEFFYLVGNPEDFDMQKAITATHEHELSDLKWVDIFNPDVDVLPLQIIDKLKSGDFSELYKITNIINE